MNFMNFRPTLTIAGRQRLKKRYERLLDRVVALLEDGLPTTERLHGNPAPQKKLFLPASVVLSVNCPGLDALNPTRLAGQQKPWQEGG
jgi:hypothetical protein